MAGPDAPAFAPLALAPRKVPISKPAGVAQGERVRLQPGGFERCSRVAAEREGGWIRPVGAWQPVPEVTRVGF